MLHVDTAALSTDIVKFDGFSMDSALPELLERWPFISCTGTIQPVNHVLDPFCAGTPFERIGESAIGAPAFNYSSDDSSFLAGKSAMSLTRMLLLASDSLTL